MKMEPISRRALVAGSAGAVFASLVPAVAQESVVSESHSLLLDMESRYNLIIRQIEVAQEEVSRCAERAHNRYMKCPKPPYISPNASYSEYFKAEFNFKRRLDRYRARRARIDDEEAGYADAKETLENLRIERDKIRGVEVWSVKAIDIQGLKTKARMAALHGNMCASTIQDLLDLAV